MGQQLHSLQNSFSTAEATALILTKSNGERTRQGNGAIRPIYTLRSAVQFARIRPAPED